MEHAAQVRWSDAIFFTAAHWQKWGPRREVDNTPRPPEAPAGHLVRGNHFVPADGPRNERARRRHGIVSTAGPGHAGCRKMARREKRIPAPVLRHENPRDSVLPLEAGGRGASERGTQAEKLRKQQQPGRHDSAVQQCIAATPRGPACNRSPLPLILSITEARLGRSLQQSGDQA